MKIESNSKHSVIAERYVDAKAISEYTSLPKGTIYEWAGQGKKCSMLSIEECKKYLNDTYTDEEVEEIRKSLYQAAELLIDKFIEDKNNVDRKVIEN